MRIKAYIATLNAAKERKLEDAKFKTIKEKFTSLPYQEYLKLHPIAKKNIKKEIYISNYLDYIHYKQDHDRYNEIRRLGRRLKKLDKQLNPGGKAPFCPGFPFEPSCPGAKSLPSLALPLPGTATAIVF